MLYHIPIFISIITLCLVYAFALLCSGFGGFYNEQNSCCENRGFFGSGAPLPILAFPLLPSLLIPVETHDLGYSLIKNSQFLFISFMATKTTTRIFGSGIITASVLSITFKRKSALKSSQNIRMTCNPKPPSSPPLPMRYGASITRRLSGWRR